MTNHLPLGAVITLHFSTDSVSLYGEPVFTVGPLVCDQAEVGSNGWATSNTTTNSIIELSNDDLQIFSNSQVYVGSIIAIPGTNGQTVEVRADDFLQILSLLQISGRVGGE
jgi:hypothetical protein